MEHRHFTSHGHPGLIGGFAWPSFPEEVIGGRPFKAFFPVISRMIPVLMGLCRHKDSDTRINGITPT
jgi:hypothetical protein